MKTGFNALRRGPRDVATPLPAVVQKAAPRKTPAPPKLDMHGTDEDDSVWRRHGARHRRSLARTEANCLRMRKVFSDSKLHETTQLPPLQQSMPNIPAAGSVPGFSFRRGEKALQECKERQELTNNASLHELPLKELQSMPVLDAFRHMLISRLGSLPQAYRYLDVNDNGNLSYSEFESGLRALQVDWSLITGKSIANLFKALDQNGSGDLSLEELLGYMPLSQDFGSANLTQHEWIRYCNQTSELAMKAQCSRPPRWTSEGVHERRVNEALDWFEEDRKHQQRREDLRRQLKEFGNKDQVTDKRTSNLKRDLVVDKKYRQIVDAEEVKRLKKQDIERTQDKVRRIQTVIRDGARARKQIVDMQKIISGVESRSKEINRDAARLFAAETLAEKVKRREQTRVVEEPHAIDLALEQAAHQLVHKHDVLLVDPSADEKVHFFETDLSEDEKALRQLAKQHNISVVDVEEIRERFREIDVNGGGSIDQDEFRNLMKKICKGSMPRDSLIKEWWQRLDKDGSNKATFDEFLGFWMTTMKNDHSAFKKTPGSRQTMKRGTHKSAVMSRLKVADGVS